MALGSTDSGRDQRKARYPAYSVRMSQGLSVPSVMNFRQPGSTSTTSVQRFRHRKFIVSVPRC